MEGGSWRQPVVGPRSQVHLGCILHVYCACMEKLCKVGLYRLSATIPVLNVPVTFAVKLPLLAVTT